MKAAAQIWQEPLNECIESGDIPTTYPVVNVFEEVLTGFRRFRT
jgi:hypothetical protein